MLRAEGDIVKLRGNGADIEAPILKGKIDMESIIVKDSSAVMRGYTVRVVNKKDAVSRLSDARRTNAVIATGNNLIKDGESMRLIDDSTGTESVFEWPSDRYVLETHRMPHMLNVRTDAPLSTSLDLVYTLKKAINCGVCYRGVINGDENTVMVWTALSLSQVDHKLELPNIQKVIVKYEPETGRRHRKLREDVENESSEVMPRLAMAASSSSSSSSASPSMYSLSPTVVSSQQLEFDLYGQTMNADEELASISPSTVKATVEYVVWNGVHPKPWVSFDEHSNLLEIPMNLVSSEESGWNELGTSIVHVVHPEDSARHTKRQTVTFQDIKTVVVKDVSVLSTNDVSSNTVTETKELQVTNLSSIRLVFKCIVSALTSKGKILVGGKTQDKFIPPPSMDYDPSLRVIPNLIAAPNTTTTYPYILRYERS
jgi:hypothetical protein